MIEIKFHVFSNKIAGRLSLNKRRKIAGYRLLLKALDVTEGRTDGTVTIYMPSQLRWRGDNKGNAKRGVSPQLKF